MVKANDTADENIRPEKGVYLMTDVLGNQRRVKVTPAEKSLKIELLEPAPKLRTNQVYDEFLYKKGSVRLKYGDLRQVYCWSSKEYKVYPESGSEPLYFEFLDKK